MKKIHISTIITALGMLLSLSSCKGFMDRGPITKPSSEGFLSAREPLEESVNALYTGLPSFTSWGMGPILDDKQSDNIISESYDRRLNGELSVNDAEGQWKGYYARLRDTNYILKFLAFPEAAMTDEIRSLVAEVYFMRAYWHFQLLKNFGSVPIMNDFWDNNATIAGLQKEPAERNELARFILEDLERAEADLQKREKYKGLRINKEAAQALAMHVALFEGSWEYYHRGTAFAPKTDEHEYFLNKVLEIGDRLLASDIKLHTIEGDHTGKAFASLFTSEDLSEISEALLWRKYSHDAGIYHLVGALLKEGVVDNAAPAGISKSFVDAFLMQDGTPVNLAREDYKDFIQTFKNRDPRLLRTVMSQGDEWAAPAAKTKPLFVGKYSEELEEKLSPPRLNGDGRGQNITAYHIRLYISDTYVSGNSITAFPILRYPLALLDYAEAAAILGRATDEVLDKTLRPLRERAGVTYVKPEGRDVFFPDYGYEISPVLREIRRERRTEFGLQGYRFEDLMRWRGHKLISGKRGRGAYLGDDSILLQSFSEEARKEIKERVILDENHYLDPLSKKLSGGYGFNPDRDYLLPIPSTEINLEKKLKQNPGW